MWGCKLRDIDYIIVRETEAVVYLNMGDTYEYIFDPVLTIFDKLNFLRIFGKYVRETDSDTESETY